jgi:competence protein ComEC
MTVLAHDAASITLLDVGHGNCSYIQDGSTLTIVDGGPNETLLEHLRLQNVETIDFVLVSHADADHVKGFGLALKALPDLRIGSVLVNPAQMRKTRTWKTFVEELESREARHATELGPLTVNAVRLPLAVGPNCALEVLGPRYVHTLGPSKQNTNSGVVRLLFNGFPVALLGADMDRLALDRLDESERDMSAHVLVFPHHGGDAETINLEGFARRLADRVDPKFTYISMGRNAYANPRPEVVRGVLSSNATTSLACSQLAKECCRRIPEGRPEFLSTKTSNGAMRNECCIGTTTITITQSIPAADPVIRIDPMPADHATHVSSMYPDRLCRVI